MFRISFVAGGWKRISTRGVTVGCASGGGSTLLWGEESLYGADGVLLVELVGVSMGVGGVCSGDPICVWSGGGTACVRRAEGVALGGVVRSS